MIFIFGISKGLRKKKSAFIVDGASPTVRAVQTAKTTEQRQPGAHVAGAAEKTAHRLREILAEYGVSAR